MSRVSRRFIPSRVLRRGGRLLAGAVLVAGVVILAVAPVPAKKKKDKFVPYMVVPAVGQPGTMGPQKVQIHREGLNAEVSYVTGVTRRRMMKATLDVDMDPFATPPGQEPFFHTFLVTLENTSDRELIFNPSRSQILTNREKFQFAIDYAVLYQGVGRRSGLSMEQVKQIVYDRTLNLRPGGKARKLLVFEKWVGKWDSFMLGLALESDGLAVLDLTVPFRKEILVGP